MLTFSVPFQIRLSSSDDHPHDRHSARVDEPRFLLGILRQFQESTEESQGKDQGELPREG